MYLTKEKKEEIFAQFGANAKDSGSAEAQIALFTYRIQHLTERMKENKKDQVTERALVGLVGKRRTGYLFRASCAATPRSGRSRHSHLQH